MGLNPFKRWVFVAREAGFDLEFKSCEDVEQREVEIISNQDLFPLVMNAKSLNYGISIAHANLLGR